MVQSQIGALPGGNSRGVSAELLDHTPPNDLELEANLLSVLLIDLELIDKVSETLRAGDFHNPTHQVVFSHLVDLRQLGKSEVDHTLFVQKLADSDDLDRAESATMTAELAARAASGQAIRHNAGIYAKQLAGLAAERTIIGAAQDALGDLYHRRSSPAEVAQRLADQAERASDRIGGGKFQLHNYAALQRMDLKAKFLIEGLLVRRQPFIVAGPAKALKTSLLVDMAVSLSTGGFFLGRYRVPEASTVALLTGESGMEVIFETIGRVSAAANVDPVGNGKLLVAPEVPMFSNPEDIEGIRKMILGYEIDVLIVDPLYFCLDGENAGNLFSQAKQLHPITRLCRKHGVTLIVAHHTKKSAGRDGADLDLTDISQAGIGEWCRQWLLVKRREPYDADGTHKLKVSIGGSAGQSGIFGLDIHEGTSTAAEGREWNVAVLNLDELPESQDASRAAKDEKKLEADARAIEECLLAHPDGRTETALRKKPDKGGAGLHTRRLKPALQCLLDEGRIVEADDVPIDGRKYTSNGYKLAPQQWEE